jgi:anti-sigma regulatory factor (Ser/Thr protein kinase)
MATHDPAAATEQTTDTATPVDDGAPPVGLLLTRKAEPTAPRAIRLRLRAWLTRWGWSDDPLEDIIAAVDEAVANVVDHAYRLQPEPGDVHVYAWITTGTDGLRTSVSVTDRGRWRAVPADPGYRGRGLLLMNTCMDSLHIEHSSGGTSVTMTSAALTPTTA